MGICWKDGLLVAISNHGNADESSSFLSSSPPTLDYDHAYDHEHRTTTTRAYLDKMYPRRTNNGEGSSRRGDHSRRRPRRIIVIRDEPVDGPPPDFEREERRHPRPPLRIPHPMDLLDPPMRPPSPVRPIRRDQPRREGIWARAQEILRRNRHFVDRIEREVALDRLEAHQAERRAQQARQERLQEEALRQRREQERRLQEHLEEVARRGKKTSLRD